jgi:hypothetical protein
MNDLEDRYEHHKVKTQNSHFAQVKIIYSLLKISVAETGVLQVVHVDFYTKKSKSDG